MVAVSVNTGLLNKASPEQHKEFRDCWEPMDLSGEKLLEHAVRGHAFAPQYRGKRRRAINFLRAGFVAADVDSGMTINDARNNGFVTSYASFIYTTASHTVENHRYRIVFALEDDVTDGVAWSNANLAIAHRVGADTSVKDAARCFFGSQSASSWVIGRKLPLQLFNELADHGADLRISKESGFSVDSTRKIAANMEVETASGTIAKLNTLKILSAIFCPYHDDKNPSAFVVQSQKGSVGIHCKACRMSYWPDVADQYDFDAFDKLCDARLAKELGQDENPFGQGLARYFPPHPSVERMSERFLPEISYRPGITLIRSPKGSGKTERLRELLEQLGRKQAVASLKAASRPKSVLLVGHRRALLRESSIKLGLRNYQELADEPREGLRTLAVCLDSLPSWTEPYPGPGSTRYRINWKRDKPFDLVLIDESEQVFSHLLGETIRKKNGGVERHFDALSYEVANAKSVIALDADMGMLTCHALSVMRPDFWQSQCRIIINKPLRKTESSRILKLYDREKAVQDELIRAVERGERCFVACNSKRSADTLHKLLRQSFGKALPMKLITSDNSQDPYEIEFLKNIATEFLNIKVLICSPSLGTGIDITFPNGAQHVDSVFGFFYPMVNTHTDMDQQLSRVRNPGSVHVWISPGRFNFTSNFETIRDDLARSYTVPRAVKGYAQDGLLRYDPDDPLLLIATHVACAQRASKNNLIGLFRKLREDNGWQIESVRTDPVPNDEKKDAIKALWNENAQGLLNAPRIDLDELIDLEALFEKYGQLSKAERFTLERGRLEHALGVCLDYEIIRMNHDGRLIDRVKTLASVLKNWSEWEYNQMQKFLDSRGALSRFANNKNHLLRALLVQTGRLTATGLTAEPVCREDLDSFSKTVLANRTVLENALGLRFQGRYNVNPIGLANKLLKLCGLKVEPLDRIRVNGKKVRRYGFEEGRMKKMLVLMQAYQDLEERKREHEALRKVA